VNRFSQFSERLLRWNYNNPDGDVWEQAQIIMDSIDAQGNTGALDALPAMAASYRAALLTGDSAKIANARMALGTVMTEAGMITAIEAARENFDPLAIIEGGP
jgi:hypothetical protein